MFFVSSKGNILCRLVKIELYKIFAIINRAIKGLHCNSLWSGGRFKNANELVNLRALKISMSYPPMYGYDILYGRARTCF